MSVESDVKGAEGEGFEISFRNTEFTGQSNQYDRAVGEKRVATRPDRKGE